MFYGIYLNHLTFKLYDSEDGTLSLFSKCLEFYEFYHVVKYFSSTKAGRFHMYACSYLLKLLILLMALYVLFVPS